MGEALRITFGQGFRRDFSHLLLVVFLHPFKGQALPLPRVPLLLVTSSPTLFVLFFFECEVSLFFLSVNPLLYISLPFES